VNPYENLTAVACLRTEAARKGRYGQFAGSVDTSQAKCKLGLRCDDVLPFARMLT